MNKIQLFSDHDDKIQDVITNGGPISEIENICNEPITFLYDSASKDTYHEKKDISNIASTDKLFSNHDKEIIDIIDGDGDDDTKLEDIQQIINSSITSLHRDSATTTTPSTRTATSTTPSTRTATSTTPSTRTTSIKKASQPLTGDPDISKFITKFDEGKNAFIQLKEDTRDEYVIGHIVIIDQTKYNFKTKSLYNKAILNYNEISPTSTAHDLWIDDIDYNTAIAKYIVSITIKDNLEEYFDKIKEEVVNIYKKNIGTIAELGEQGLQTQRMMIEQNLNTYLNHYTLLYVPEEGDTNLDEAEEGNHDYDEDDDNNVFSKFIRLSLEKIDRTDMENYTLNNIFEELLEKSLNSSLDFYSNNNMDKLKTIAKENFPLTFKIDKI